jgi:hypothetical protein
MKFSIFGNDGQGFPAHDLTVKKNVVLRKSCYTRKRKKKFSQKKSSKAGYQ